MPYKTIKLNRKELYDEIWNSSLSKVSKKYNIPYPKLKEACEKYNIPVQPKSYWGDKAVGKTVEMIPLPASNETEVVVDYKTTISLNTLAINELIKTQDQISEINEENKPVVSQNSSEPNRYERNKLYNEVWTEPCTKVAAKYGVSDVMIHKICKSLEIPVPPRGYWAKIAAGQKIKETPLPEYNGKEVIIGNKKLSDSEKAISNAADKTLSFLNEVERNDLLTTAMNLNVEDEEKRLHQVLRNHKARYKEWKRKNPRDDHASLKKDRYRRIPEGEPELWTDVSEMILPRIYHILNTIFKAVKLLGGDINEDLSMNIRGENVCVYFSESQRSTAHILTSKEKKQLEEYQSRKSLYLWSEPRFRKYDYIPTGKLTLTVPYCGIFRDSNNHKIESRLGEVLIALYAESEVVRNDRLAREERARIAEEERKQKERVRERYNEEVEKYEALENEAMDYQMANMIRNYVLAVESQNKESQNDEWIKWAKAKADWIDPTVSAEDPFFGKRDHSQSSDRKKPSKKSSYWLF